MTRRPLVAVVASLALAAPLVPGPSDAADTRSATSVTGRWKGTVLGEDGGPAGYPARVRIFRRDGKLHGRVVYPDYCAGRWRFTGESGGTYAFRERITHDPDSPTCASPLKVRVRREGARLRVLWIEPDTGDRDTMLARRR